MPYGYDINLNGKQTIKTTDDFVAGLRGAIDTGMGFKRLQMEQEQNDLAKLQFDEQKKQKEIERLVENGKYGLSVVKDRNVEDEFKVSAHNKMVLPWLRYMGVDNVQPVDSWEDGYTELGEKFSKIASSGLKDEDKALNMRIAIAKYGGDAGKYESVAKHFEDKAGLFKKEPTQSFSFQGFQGGDPIFSSNRSTQLIAGKSPSNQPILPKTLTGEQTNSAIFATRANDANLQLDDLTKTGFDPTDPSQVIESRLPNLFKGQGAQSIEQIGRNFVAAVLRKESGAAITKDEWAEGRKQYIPQPGDTTEVLKLKALNRQRAIQGFQLQSGNLNLGGSSGGGSNDPLGVR